MNVLRTFLEQNKIFFETVAALSLSIMAVVVSIAEVRVAAQQNALVELQTQIERQQLLPQIQVDSVQSINRDTNGEILANDERIVVTSFSGLVRSPSENTAVYLDVYISPIDPRPDKSSAQKTFAITDYYGVTLISNQAIGKVLETFGDDNITKWSKLQQEFDALAENMGYYADLRIRDYIQITYQDVFGDFHEEYYLVTPITGGSQIPSAEGIKIFQEFDNMWTSGKYVMLSTITAETLMEEVLSTSSADD